MATLRRRNSYVKKDETSFIQVLPKEILVAADCTHGKLEVTSPNCTVLSLMKDFQTLLSTGKRTHILHMN